MVYAGGDSAVSMKRPEDTTNGTGSEIRALDVLADRWTLLRPFAVSGEVQPGRPDTVGWAYDATRNRGLMSPGFYFITQGNVSGYGAIDGWGGYAFDFATLKFSGIDDVVGLPAPPGGWGGDSGASYAVCNPTLDEYVRIFGSSLQRLDLGTKTWRVQNLAFPGDGSWVPFANREQLVIDVKGQALYFRGPASPGPGAALIKVDLATAMLTQIPLPAGYVSPPPDHEVYLAFDPQNRVVILPNNVDMGGLPLNGLGLYWVDTDVWEWESVPAEVMGGVWGFDEHAGALVGVGKHVPPYAYFLYKVR
jgi:hypothetical protein